MNIIGEGGFAREVNEYMGGLNQLHLTEDRGGLKYGSWALVCIGDPKHRERISAKYILQSYYGGYCKSYDIGDGFIACPGSVVTVNCSIGKGFILNLNATVGHDCVIGDFVTVSPGANISGNVTIGDRCYIGTGAAIIEGIKICDDVTIGAGAVVVKDITEVGTYVGVPTRKI